MRCMPSLELSPDALPDAAAAYPIYIRYIKAMHAIDVLPKRDLLSLELFTANLWGDCTDDQKRDFLTRWEQDAIDAELAADHSKVYTLYIEAQKVRRQLDATLTDLSEQAHADEWQALDGYDRKKRIRSDKRVIAGEPPEESAADIIKRYMRRREAAAS